MKKNAGFWLIACLFPCLFSLNAYGASINWESVKSVSSSNYQLIAPKVYENCVIPPDDGGDYADCELGFLFNNTRAVISNFNSSFFKLTWDKPGIVNESIAFYSSIKFVNETTCQNYPTFNLKTGLGSNKVCKTSTYYDFDGEKTVSSLPTGLLGVKIKLKKPKWEVYNFNITAGLSVASLSLDPTISACGNLTSSGYYTLTTDLFTGHLCINVSVNDVIFDCANHFLEADYVDSIAFWTQSYQNLTIKHCQLLFGQGLYATNFINLTLEDFNASIMDISPVLAYNITNFNIRNSFFESGGTDALGLGDSNNVVIENSTFNSTANYGINDFSTANTRFYFNRTFKNLRFNSATAGYVCYSVANLYSRNAFFQNPGAYDIALFEQCDNQTWDSTITRTAPTDYYVYTDFLDFRAPKEIMILNWTQLDRSKVSISTEGGGNKAYIQWYAQGNVTWLNGTPAGGALVNASNNASINYSMGQAAANGLTSWFVVNETQINPTLVQMLYNFTANLSTSINWTNNQILNESKTIPIILVLVSTPPCGTCFQALANVSNDCGGLATGTYNFDATSFPGRMVDDNYSSYGALDQGTKANFTANYSKPTTALSAKWAVANGNGELTQSTATNYSIPSLCFIQEPIRLMENNSGAGDVKAYCWAGSYWLDLGSPGGLGNRVYDEGVYWIYEGCSSSCSIETKRNILLSSNPFAAQSEIVYILIGLLLGFVIGQGLGLIEKRKVS